VTVKIVAEIGINHNGDLAIAKQLMAMAKEAGADFVKFQKRDIEAVYSPEFLDSIRESPWGKTQRDQKEGLEFGADEFMQIDHSSWSMGIPWFASCWDVLSLRFVEGFNPPLHKIASPMLTNLKFVEAVARMGRKTLVSTGMSTMEDITAAVEILKDHGVKVVLLHCVSEYPCSDERCSLGMIQVLKERFGCEVGYSNHSPGIESCIGAAYLGAEWIECHITLDRSMYGSDQASSLERRGLELVCKYARNARTIIGDGVKIITAAERANAAKLRYWQNG
jgi:N-acetylneuraminate synthase